MMATKRSPHVERQRARQIIDASYAEAGADKIECHVCGKPFRPKPTVSGTTTRTVCGGKCAMIAIERRERGGA